MNLVLNWCSATGVIFCSLECFMQIALCREKKIGFLYFITNPGPHHSATLSAYAGKFWVSALCCAAKEPYSQSYAIFLSYLQWLFDWISTLNFSPNATATQTYMRSQLHITFSQPYVKGSVSVSNVSAGESVD